MNKYTTCLLFLLLTTMACEQKVSYSPWLIQADSLMEAKPEVALNLLQDTAHNNLRTSADRYCRYERQRKDHLLKEFGGIS